MPFALCAVMPPGDLASGGAGGANAPREVIGPLLEALVSEGVFTQVYHGSSPEDFSGLAADEDLVVLAGSPGCVQVLEHLVGPPIEDEVSSGTSGPPSRVKLVHSLFTGVDGINPHRLHGILTKRGIPLSNTRSVFAEMLAQHVLLSILYFNRQVPKLLANRREKRWERFASPTTLTMTMVVCGFGDIGRCCALRAKQGLGLKKIYGVRSEGSCPCEGLGSVVDELTGAEVVFGNAAMDKVLPEADIVLAVLPNTPGSQSVFDDARFSKFKEGALFINIGRGCTVEEAALLKHLEEGGRLRGAALDVFRTEPLPAESPFWNEDLLPSSKLLLTPHNADIGLSMNEESVEYFCRVARRFVLEGQLPEYLVDLAKGY